MTTSNQSIARFAGIGYLIIFITGIFSNFFVVEGLIVLGDAASTTANIRANVLLFRTGIFSFILMVIFDVLLAWALYLLLKPVNNRLSLLSGWLRLVNSAIFAIALYHLLHILNILQDEAYAQIFSTEHLSGLVLLSLSAFNNGWLLGLVFFGLHLLVMGCLIYKSGFIPRVIGILLIIAGIGYLADSFANFILTNYNDYKDIFMMIVVLPGVVGELSLTFWLLLKNKTFAETEQ